MLSRERRAVIGPHQDAAGPAGAPGRNPAVCTDPSLTAIEARRVDLTAGELINSTLNDHWAWQGSKTPWPLEQRNGRLVESAGSSVLMLEA